MSAAIVRMLEIERGNVGGEYRPALTAGGETGDEVDVYLYDTTSGGAGFVQSATRDPRAFLETTLELLEDCDCTHSCYKCLHTYENRYYHADLDRKLAATFLRHILGRELLPTLGPETENRLLRSLGQDLQDSGESIQYGDGYLDIQSRDNKRIVLSHSFSNQPGSARAFSALSSATGEQLMLPHLLVERALPVAQHRALGLADTELGVISKTIPTVEEGGIEVYDLESLQEGWQEAAPVCRVAVQALEGKPVFILRLSESIMERFPIKRPVGRSGREETVARMEAGSYLVCQRIEELEPSDSMNRLIAVLRHESDIFRATGKSSTVGFIQLRGENKGRISVGYSSSKSTCQPETLTINGIKTLGIVRGILKDGDVIEIKKEKNGS